MCYISIQRRVKCKKGFWFRRWSMGEKDITTAVFYETSSREIETVEMKLNWFSHQTHNTCISNQRQVCKLMWHLRLWRYLFSRRWPGDRGRISVWMSCSLKTQHKPGSNLLPDITFVLYFFVSFGQQPFSNVRLSD